METTVATPIGYAGKERLMAAFLDNAFAYLGSFVIVMALPSPMRWVLLVILYLAYFAVFEALWSRTPGKAMFGLLVRTLDNKQPSASAALTRTLFRLLEVNPFLLGAIPGGIAILMSERRQRLGDRVAETVVVRRSKASPSAGPSN